jgi:hypothetical protein
MVILICQCGPLITDKFYSTSQKLLRSPNYKYLFTALKQKFLLRKTLREYLKVLQPQCELRFRNGISLRPTSVREPQRLRSGRGSAVSLCITSFDLLPEVEVQEC